MAKTLSEDLRSRLIGADEAERAARVDVSIVAVGATSIMCTGMNTGISDVAVSASSRTCRRHVNSRLSQTPWCAATARIAVPGSRVSATKRSLSAVLHRRRRSRPVMISTTPSINTPQVPT
jgi:hypothetical protein